MQRYASARVTSCSSNSSQSSQSSSGITLPLFVSLSRRTARTYSISSIRKITPACVPVRVHVRATCTTMHIVLSLAQGFHLLSEQPCVLSIGVCEPTERLPSRTMYNASYRVPLGARKNNCARDSLRKHRSQIDVERQNFHRSDEARSENISRSDRVSFVPVARGVGENRENHAQRRSNLTLCTCIRKQELFIVIKHAAAQAPRLFFLFLGGLRRIMCAASHTRLRLLQYALASFSPATQSTWLNVLRRRGRDGTEDDSASCTYVCACSRVKCQILRLQAYKTNSFEREYKTWHCVTTMRRQFVKPANATRRIIRRLARTVVLAAASPQAMKCAPVSQFGDDTSKFEPKLRAPRYCESAIKFMISTQVITVCGRRIKTLTISLLQRAGAAGGKREFVTASTGAVYVRIASRHRYGSGTIKATRDSSIYASASVEMRPIVNSPRGLFREQLPLLLLLQL
ncbi:unnamed protein product [Trichogramma brassicae]|uniref:Uncharacterized protein n=1 Tax=Trichogramma brassicae TaxID=86971 RepID=A0A6H5ITU4_9HYME|nr:unnamed protein product [Trichogramma brassicae]